MNTIKKQGGKYTTDAKFDKYGSKVSKIETFKEVDKETITKEHVTSLSRDNTNSLRDQNDDNLDDMDDYK